MRLGDGQRDPPGRHRVFALPTTYGVRLIVHHPTRWRMDLQEIVADDGTVLLTSQGATPEVWTPTPTGKARLDLKRLIWGARRYVCAPQRGPTPRIPDAATRAEFLNTVRTAVAEVRASGPIATAEAVAVFLRPTKNDPRPVHASPYHG